MGRSNKENNKARNLTTPGFILLIIASDFSFALSVPDIAYSSAFAELDIESPLLDIADLIQPLVDLFFPASQFFALN